jgi:hypothetical protein
MAACGWVRDCHCRRRPVRPLTRQALRGRGSGLGNQRPASCYNRLGYCAGRAAARKQHRRSRTSLAHRSWHRLAARAVHPLPCRQPVARGGTALFSDAGAGKIAGRRRSITGLSRMRPPLLAMWPPPPDAAAACCLAAGGGNTRLTSLRPASAAAAGTERCPPPPLERAACLSSGDFRRVSTRGLWVGIITKIVQGQFGSYSSRRTNLANSMTTRECEPIPISLAPSVALP